MMTLHGAPSNASDYQTDAEVLITDFSSGGADLGWYVVNDNVMGGRSDGDFQQQAGQLRFAGRTNTRGGGFSSIRTAAMRLDASSYDGIRLAVKGDGRRYTWRLTTDARWRGREVGYWADFETLPGKWSTVDIPFSRFIPQFRGVELDGPQLDPAQITGMGLMIYDKQDGPFKMDVASVRAYSAKEPFAVAQYAWKFRVLAISAPAEDDKHFVEQRNSINLGRKDFADRDMVLVTLLDDGVSTAGDRQLTGAETAATRAALGMRSGSFALRLVGKDGSVKLSRQVAIPMSEIYALIDAMPMRQQEKSDRAQRE